jgi:hypothetical protein
MNLNCRRRGRPSQDGSKREHGKMFTAEAQRRREEKKASGGMLGGERGT